MDSKPEAPYDELLNFFTGQSDYFLLQRNLARGQGYAQLALALSARAEVELIRTTFENELDPEISAEVLEVMGKSKRVYEMAFALLKEKNRKQQKLGKGYAMLANAHASRAKLMLERWKLSHKS